MKIIYSKYLPVKGFRAINLFGVIFARIEQPRLDKKIINHEAIHTRQMLEMLIVPFYTWYIIEWIIKWIRYNDRYLAYKNIGFEREAFANDFNSNYLKQRKWYAFIKYI